MTGLERCYKYSSLQAYKQLAKYVGINNAANESDM